MLYEFEKTAIKRERSAALPKKKLGRPPLPKPLPEPRGIIAPEITGEIEPNKGGRPVLLRKLTPEVVDKVIANVRMGLPQESALVLAGITRQAVDKWRQRNPLLQIRFEQAECEFEAEMVARINTFGKTDTKSTQWLIERRLNRWAPVTKAELTGKDGAPLGAMTVSQQLFASVAGAKDAPGKSRRAAAEPIDVTPAKT